jgi:hypothetical protein
MKFSHIIWEQLLSFVVGKLRDAARGIFSGFKKNIYFCAAILVVYYMDKKILLTALILLSGIMLSVIGKAHNVRDSIPSNTLDTIVSYDIFDKLSESGEGRATLGGDDVRSIISEMKLQKNKSLKGWRIRIFRDRDQAASRRAENIKNNIVKTYPGLPAYVTHNSPIFYVDVGDYRTQDEAEKMRRKLTASFPVASLVSVYINFPPL